MRDLIFVLILIVGSFVIFIYNDTKEVQPDVNAIRARHVVVTDSLDEEEYFGSHIPKLPAYGTPEWREYGRKIEIERAMRAQSDPPKSDCCCKCCN